MKTLAIMIGVGLSLITGAFAQVPEPEAEEFLLGDLGVRVDLSDAWKMTRWSDWDFEGKSDEVPLLWVWSTDLQSEIGEDPAVWFPIHEQKLAAQGFFDLKLEKSSIRSAHGQDVAALDLSAKIDASDPTSLLYYGASFPIEGATLHLGVAILPRGEERGKSELIQILERLEVRSPVPVRPPVLMLEAKGITSEVPKGWREPGKAELKATMEQVSGLGIEDATDCWVAIKVRPAADTPDVMVTCQGGLYLGVVDRYSFDGADALLREKMFGVTGASMKGEPIELDDRLGFFYHPDLSTKGLYVAGVPYDLGVSRTWVVGAAGDDMLGVDLSRVVENSRWSGEHPASFGDRVSYWLVYRTFSPVVLGFFALMLALLGGVAFLGSKLLGGRKNKYEFLDDET